MDKIRAAVVGYGNIGKSVVEALEVAPDFEIAGVVRRSGAANKPAELEGYEVVKDIKELKNYYSGRTDVSVPLVNLSSTSYTSSQKWIADQALKDNGYRFYIAKNYVESTSSEGDVYYSFLDTDGGVNWDLRPTTEEMFTIAPAP